MKRIRFAALTLALSIALCLAFPTGAAAAENLSDGQANIVKRARQLMEIKWTPLQDRYIWGQAGIYRAGRTYTGVPYGQPVNTRGYIGFDISIDDFAAAVSDYNSAFYSSYSYFNKTAPSYSTDCSGFVSYAWGLKTRVTTRDIPSVSEKVASQSVSALQVGDCLDYPGVHAVLVSSVEHDAWGNVSAVEIMEQNSWGPEWKRYGAGGSATLPQLKSKYFDSGYSLYRYAGRYDVPYVHSCAAPLEGDYHLDCGAGVGKYWDIPHKAWYSEAVYYATARGLFIGTGSGTFSPGLYMTEAMFLTVVARMYGGTTDYAKLSSAYITREEMCRLLYDYAMDRGLWLPSGGSAFADDYAIDPANKTAVYALKNAGIINGVGGGYFDPDGVATRAQVAQLIMMFLTKTA